MSHATSASTLILTALTLGACFDPMVDPVDSGGPGSGTDSAGTTLGSTTSIDTESAEGIADSTGTFDAPPEIQAFTVNGSTAPTEQQVAGMIAFDVDAIDDVGIDRVEIYDGGELIATVESSPYVVEVLVSSADNGSHAYTAVAVDTAGQTDESEAVPLSVNVVGGAILNLRQDIASFRISTAINIQPQISLGTTNEILVTATVREDIAQNERYGFTAISYSDSLSLLWSDTLFPLQLGPYVTYANCAHPVFDPAHSNWLSGGMLVGQTEIQRAVYTIDPAIEGIVEFASLGLTNDLFPTPVALDFDGNLFHSSIPSQLEKRSALDGAPIWAVPIGDGEAAFTDIFITPTNDIILSIAEWDCIPGSNHCIVKLSPEGDVLWTRPAGTSTTATALSPTGGAAVVMGYDTPLHLVVFDENGNTVVDRALADDAIYQPRDLSYDAQGSLVIAGDLWARPGDYDERAWATRVDQQGNLTWFQIYEFDVDHGITSLATNANGKLFALGWETSFDPDIVGWSGRGWLAELAL